jgi:hypothetical protein
MYVEGDTLDGQGRQIGDGERNWGTNGRHLGCAAEETGNFFAC